MPDGILIANRGEIACRILKTLRRLGLGTIAVHSEADRYSPHVREADRTVCIGPVSTRDSYLNGAAVLDAARITGARAVFPGYGLLSQRAGFARAIETGGFAFIGPTPEQLAALAENARGLAAAAGLRLAPRGSVQHARHIEVQVFGDGRGTVVALGERDCSAKRNGSTILAEAPAPNLDPQVRCELADAAIAMLRPLAYRSSGIVEFTYDASRGSFYFHAMHPHIGIEHAVAEAVSGVDLVEWMVALALGRGPELAGFSLEPRGHAIQARVYAEDPAREFRRSSGLVTEATFAENVRVDAWVERGVELGAEHDPLLAKLTALAPDRDAALGELASALSATRIGGLETNLGYLAQVLRDPLFIASELTTRSLERVVPESASIEVFSSGPLSTVVDHPGRLGFWHVGIPPSGPMDSLAHRLANRVVGNPESSAGLEFTLTGPRLRFTSDAVFALGGPRFQATLDGEPVPFYRPVRVRAGQLLAIGSVEGPGCRGYLAVRGGLDVPAYLHSRTTFVLGGFGGHGGRALRPGDVLHIGNDEPLSEPALLPPELWPQHDKHWQIGVLYGPHGAPDFFTPSDIETLFSTDWEVHYNSNRTGVRLIGPKPQWARPDGGEAGLHPSNVHDVPYAIGAIDYTGDMPILLGPDGPSLGGFVCPAVVVEAELWKLGQLKAGDRVRFVPITPEAAEELERAQLLQIAQLGGEAPPRLTAVAPEGPIRRELPETDERVRVVYRRAGDKYLIVEYGPLVLDLRLRFRVHALMSWLQAARLPGIIDLTPGIRSLQIHYDNLVLPAERLLDALVTAERELPVNADTAVPSRTVHLPLSWDDPATRVAIAKYVQSVRADAPWCPDNIEFIRRINGLESVRDVYDIVFQASYLVLGLGDVYLGAPVATPIDPRQRLVTTKYNPARTWTPENAVGIGGAYLCIYGMEGPGGYQFVGRTLQVYNRFRKTAQFRDETPWLLRFFDQIRFYPVGAEDLLEMREAFLYGKAEVRIEEGLFRLSEYERLLSQNRQSISTFKTRQQAAFDAERQRWLDSGQLAKSEANGEPSKSTVAAARAEPTSEGPAPPGA